MGAGFGGSILALVARSRAHDFEVALARPVMFCATADGAFARK
jgi:galactokinase